MIKWRNKITFIKWMNNQEQLLTWIQFLLVAGLAVWREDIVPEERQLPQLRELQLRGGGRYNLPHAHQVGAHASRRSVNTVQRYFCNGLYNHGVLEEVRHTQQSFVWVGNLFWSNFVFLRSAWWKAENYGDKRKIPNWRNSGSSVHLLAVPPSSQPHLVHQRGEGELTTNV